MILKYNNRVVTHNDRWIDYTNQSGIQLQTVIETGNNQYGWLIPIDILLNCVNNGLVLNITAYTTETGTGGWDNDHGDYRFFAQRSNYTREYTLLDNVVPFAPIDSNGYRGMTISDWMHASLYNIQTWKSDGDTQVVLHAPASQVSKFIEPPVCIMTYNG